MQTNTDFSNNLPEVKLNSYESLRDWLAADLDDIHYDYISKQEQARLLAGYNQTDAFFPDDVTLHELFDQQVRKTPQKIACTFDEEKITYKMLQNRSNQLAALIHDRCGKFPDVKLSENTLIGIYTERGIDMVVGILAVLKAGYAYLPFDHEYPKDRLRFIIEDAQPVIILTQKHLLAHIDKKFHDVCLDIKMAHKPTQHSLGRYGNPNDLAYVIYTSGSTGTPKGVLIKHKSVVNLAFMQIKQFRIDKNTKALQFASIGFDASVWEIFAPLLIGATICIADDSVRHDVNRLWHYINNEKATLATLPPPILRLLPKKNLKSLKTLIVAGDRCDSDVMNFWARKTQLINAYGPTEGTVCASLSEYHIGMSATEIGRSIQNTTAYVLDKFLRPLPIGMQGELYIGGIGVACGYLNRPELTTERFVADPFVPGGKIYRTGDFVRRLATGSLEFIGRIDNQVKIRGYRVELGEIENALAKHNNIKESFVDVIRKDDHKKLVAYYTAEEAGQSINNLKSYLADILPDYMIPAYFVELKSMPLTLNGKIDKKVLPQTFDRKMTALCEYMSPVTTKEKILAKIWSDLLKIKNVGVNDNFFSLGGDSIIGIQVVFRLRQAGYDLKPKDLFANPTVAELSRVAEGRKAKVNDDNYALVEGNARLLPIQKRFFEFGYSEESHFNQSFLLKLNIKLEEKEWLKIFEKLFEHHDALRLKYKKYQNSIVQYYSNDSDVSFEAFDLIDKDDKIISETCSKLQKDLDIYKGPIFKAALFLNTQDEHDRLFIVVHHLVIDGVSWRIILDDLVTLINRITSGKELLLPSKTDTYASWGEGLTRYLEESKEQELAWEKTSSEIVLLPRDPERKNKKSEKEIKAFLNKEETGRLINEAPKAYYTQINDVLLSAFCLAVNRTYDLKTVSLDLEGHGREDCIQGVDVSRTVGWFTSIYPVSFTLPEKTSFKEDSLSKTIKAVKEQLRKIKDKGLGYGVIRYLGAQTDVRALSPDVLFNYLGVMDEDQFEDFFSIDTQNKGRDISFENKPPHGLNVNAWISNKKLQITFGYDPYLFSQKSMENLLENFRSFLLSIIEHCSSQKIGQHTASDFDLKGVSEDSLVGILEQKARDDEFSYEVEEF